MQNISNVGCLCKMIQLKKKKVVENHLKVFYVITCDKQDIISALKVAFEGEIIITQYCIKILNAYFSKNKLGIEIDEYNHEGRNPNYEKSRQLMIESHRITIIATNPEASDFVMNRLINQIYKHIIKSIKNRLKKKLQNKPKNH